MHLHQTETIFSKWVPLHAEVNYPCALILNKILFTYTLNQLLIKEYNYVSQFQYTSKIRLYY